MKIYDIISEAVPPGVGTAINAVKAVAKGAKGAKDIPDIPKKTLDDILRMDAAELTKFASDRKGAAELTALGKEATDAMNYKAMDKIADALPKDTRNWYQKIAPNLIGGKTIDPNVLAAQALKNTSLRGKASDVVNLTIAAGLLQEAVKYWDRSSELDKQLAAGMSQEEYNKQLQQLRGQFMLGTIVPWAGVAVLGTPGVLIRFIPAAMTLFKMPNAGQITLTLTKTSGQLALLGFLARDDGKKWLNDLAGGTIFGTLGNIAKMAGEISTALYATARVATGIALPDKYEPRSTELGGGSGGRIDLTKDSGRSGGL